MLTDPFYVSETAEVW